MTNPVREPWSRSCCGNRVNRVLFFIFDDISLIGVDNRGASVRRGSFIAAPVSGVNVPVDEIIRPVFFDQPVECFESRVGQIVSVVKVIGRRVGDKDVKAFVKKKL